MKKSVYALFFVFTAVLAVFYFYNIKNEEASFQEDKNVADVQSNTEKDFESAKKSNADFVVSTTSESVAVSEDENFNVQNKEKEKTDVKTESEDRNKFVKLLKPLNGQIYFGAFPDFGGPEDNVTKERILDFENLSGTKIVWAYFSQNWFNGIKYPKREIHEIYEQGIVPFVRLMPRSSEEQFVVEKKFSLENIINGKFDTDLKSWAKEAKEDNIPLLLDFAVEPNGDWFSWSGFYNGKGTKDGYGDLNYYDGPERYRDAYKHIINIFKEEDVKNITWFFHVDIYSNPNEDWNSPKYYYPGDDYIDWIGVSVYGPQNTGEDYWETFSEILKNRYKSILDISTQKPFALLEFGVTDASPYGEKAEWLKDAFETVLNGRYIKFDAISYWNENWEEENGSKAFIRIDSSKANLDMFRLYAQNKKFISIPRFSNLKTFPKNNFVKSVNLSQTKKAERYKPTPGTTWQWQLSGKLNTSYDVDLYDVDLFETTKEQIKKMHNDGRKVICYFNAGAYESYRDDSSQFPESVLGDVMEGWEDERWLDVSSYEKFASIMKKRLDLAFEKGCDGVEPDNVDGYQNNTGFNISYQDQLEYNKWLADEAHKRNLSVALKNDLEQVNDLVSHFDFAINEECFYYDECSLLLPFIKSDKAVLGVEYELDTKDFCNKANTLNFSWLKMEYDLDGGRVSCK